MSYRIPHSAHVSMTLHLAGVDLPVCQMAPDWIILRTAPTEDWPPGEASLTLVVDERRETFPVSLPHGITRGERRIVTSDAKAEE
jgi:hypothetical protein